MNLIYIKYKKSINNKNNNNNNNNNNIYVFMNELNYFDLI